jgi:hypothetical protein
MWLLSVGVIIFSSVRFLSKKVTKPIFFFEKKNRTETGRFDTVSVFLGQKSVQTGLARFFQFWLGFSGLARFFRFGSVLARFFFRFLSVSFRFGLVFSVFCL